MTKAFLSGNDAFAEGVRLARPQVISMWLKDFRKWLKTAV